MGRHRWGGIAIAGLAGLNVALWLIFPPEDDGRRLFWLQLASEVLSSTGMVLMACAIVLSLRLRAIEPLFGGLDKMYRAHKLSAVAGLVLVLLHFVTMPGSEEPSVGRLLGKVALLGMLALVVLSLAPRLPAIGGYMQLAYHRWRLTHKLVGAFFILGIVHTLQVKNVLQYAEIPALYWKIVAYAGAAAYLYRVLAAPLLARGARFSVADVRRLNPSTVEVTLRPEGRMPPQRAGQFAFVSFPGSRGLAEPHPFTVSSAPQEGQIRFAIKAAGDWTKQLYAELQPGAEARVDGCYGMFDHTAGGARQIWVAGGIGVTPFLSWVRSLEQAPAAHIHLFYTARADSDALYWDELEAAAARHPTLRATLNISSRDGSLTADKIAAQVGGDLSGHSVFLCGPAAMTSALAAQLRARGVQAGSIHYEEFNFR